MESNYFNDFIVNLSSELFVAPLCLLIFHAIVCDSLLKYNVISDVGWIKWSWWRDLNESVFPNDAQGRTCII